MKNKNYDKELVKRLKEIQKQETELKTEKQEIIKKILMQDKNE